MEGISSRIVTPAAFLTLVDDVLASPDRAIGAF
jgi:hypothetical protein